MTTHDIKAAGYLVSIVSVLLLFIPPLKSAREDPLLLACLIAGAATSVIGMLMRWVADKRTQERISRAQNENSGPASAR